eukprot:PhF_6_TR9221/c0_g1_i3/m.14501
MTDSAKKVKIDDKIQILPVEEAQSYASSMITADPTVSAGERLYSHGVELLKTRIQKHQEEKASRELHEKDGCPFMPTIMKPNEKHDMDEFVKRMDTWAKQRNRRHDDKANKRTKEVMEDVTFKPNVDKLSAKLITFKSKKKQYANPVKGWKTHFTNYVLSKQGDVIHGPNGAEPEHTFRPAINEASRTLHFPTPVTERLYRDTQHRKAQLELIQMWDHVRKGYDVKTGQPLFRPSTNAGSSYGGSRSMSSQRSRTPSGMSLMSSGSVIDNLLEKGEEYREHRRQLEEEKFKGMTFQPKTNPKSRRIVQEIAAKGPTQSHRRASREPSPQPQHEVLDTSATSTHRSRSADTSAKKVFDVDKFYARVSMERSLHEAKLTLLREQNEADASTECTFRPSISRNSVMLFRRSHGGGAELSPPPQYRSPIGGVKPTSTSTHSKPQQKQQQQQQHHPEWIEPAGTTGRPEDFVPTPVGSRAADSVGRSGGGGVSEIGHQPQQKSEFLKSLEQELRSTVEDWKKI